VLWGTQSAKCPKCREPQLRKQWGCDEAAAWPIYTQSCGSCCGAGCADCQNRGSVAVNRCPFSQTGSYALEIARLASAVEAGFLPTAGGYLDQPAAIMRLVELTLQEKARINGAEQANNKG
jgi:hypothetical protein